MSQKLNGNCRQTFREMNVGLAVRTKLPHSGRCHGTKTQKFLSKFQYSVDKKIFSFSWKKLSFLVSYWRKLRKQLYP